jgi:hypothetical protein
VETYIRKEEYGKFRRKYGKVSPCFIYFEGGYFQPTATCSKSQYILYAEVEDR